MSTALLRDPAAAVAWLRGKGCTRLVTDSRRVQISDALIAWPGAAVDGRQFIPAAIAKGAACALMESQDAPEVLLTMPSVCAYQHLKTAAGDIASLFYGEPSHALQVVAFTGTNGKTSSSWWLAEALSHLPAPHTRICAVVGTLGAGQIDRLEPNGLTTPDPVLLQEKLHAFAAQNCKVVALEASSIGIAEGRLNGTRIHTAVFTNFTQDHLDYHGTMEAYWQAKASLFDWPHLKAVVINLDDTQGLALLDRVRERALDVWTFGMDRAARLQATNIRTTAQGLAFDVTEQTSGDTHQSHPLQTHLIGHYNINNLLGVIAAMRTLGVSLALCLETCAKISPVPGRLEIVSQAAQPLTVIDYAHSPDALEKVLLALREITTERGGTLWCVFGCGGKRDASKRPIMGAIAARFADNVVVTSDNPRDENPNTIASHILRGTSDERAVQVQVNRALAIDETIVQAKASDVILIAGKGHEDYQEIAGVLHPFSDQQHARAALTTWSAKP